MINNKQKLLDQIKADIVNQNICPDLAQEATNLVMGHGNIDARIVFIGEAPGKKEDESGVPFVGAAGKFLDSLLETIDLKRADVYITNIVKYRPPKNRDPLPVEKQAFVPFLAQELAVIDPKVIVTLGRHSMEYFLPDAKIGEVHGQFHEVIFEGEKRIFLPLYHPAAALYNGALRKTLQADILQLTKLLI